MLYVVPETVLVSELELKRFKLESVKVMTEIIKLAALVNHIEFKEEIKRQVMKGLRYHEFYIKMDAETVERLLNLMELDNDEEIGIFTLLFGRQIEASKWKNILVFIAKISEIRFTQSHL